MALFRTSTPDHRIAYINIDEEKKTLTIVYKDFVETRQKIELR